MALSSNFEDLLIFSSFGSATSRELEVLKGEIANAIIENTRNSGKAVNSIGVPAMTSGDTIESMRVEKEAGSGELIFRLVGRKGIWNIDRGNPPAKDSEEWTSFNSFYDAIKRWARAKEVRYGLPKINAYWVASNVWHKGGVLYRAGGGTQSVFEKTISALESIDIAVQSEVDTLAELILNKIANEDY